MGDVIGKFLHKVFQAFYVQRSFEAISKKGKSLYNLHRSTKWHKGGNDLFALELP